MKGIKMIDTELNELTYPLLASEKIDGVQCRIEPGNPPTSRSGRPFRNPHLADYLAPLQQIADSTRLTIVGELLSPSLGFSKTAGAIVHGTEPLPDDLKIHLFDVQDETLTFAGKVRVLEGYRPSPCFCVVGQRIVGSVGEAREFYQSVVGNGGEGIVLRSPEDTDEQIYRCKATVTLDAVCVGFREGKGRLSGMLGAISVQLADGRRCSIGGGFDDAERKRVWADRDNLVGRWVEFRAMAVGAVRSPRQPRFCRWRESDCAGKI